MIELWPHQVAAINAVLLAMELGLRAGMVVLPTGTGKTGMVLSLGRRLGLPTLFLVDRDVLITQTLKAAEHFWPEARIGIIKADLDQWDGGRDLVIASVQSLHKARLLAIPRDRFGFAICDEAHMAAAPSWSAILDHFLPGYLLGVTATPKRLDGKPLDRFGREPVYTYSLIQAIKDGRLVGLVQKAIQTTTDLDSVGSEDGDLKKKQLAVTVNTPERNKIVVDAYRQNALGRKAIAFGVDIDHAEALARQFDLAGFAAEVISSRNKHEQEVILANFAAGWLSVLVSCDMLTTGFDDPATDCVLMARPTESQSLYIQMVGRGLRLAPGKNDLLVLDFTDNCKKHKLICALDLLGRQRKEETPDQEREPLPASERCAQESQERIVSWKLEEVCPWPSMPTLEGYEPTQPWHDDEASEGQIRFIRSFGLTPEKELTKGEAGYLIDRCQEFEACWPAPATPKQRYFLEREGLWTNGMGKRQASKLIQQVKEKEAAQA